MNELMEIQGIQQIENAYYTLELHNTFFSKPLLKQAYAQLEADKNTITLLAPIKKNEVTAMFTGYQDAILLERYQTKDNKAVNIYDSSLRNQEIALTNTYANQAHVLEDMKLTFQIRDILQAEAVGMKRDRLDFYYQDTLLVKKERIKEIYQTYGTSNPNVAVTGSHITLHVVQKENVLKQIKALQKKHPYTILSVTDAATMYNAMLIDQLSLSFTVAGFLILIILIVLVNFINVIASNLLTKKREYATLISLGMKSKEITEILIIKNMRVITSSLLWGILVSQIITFIFSKLVQGASYSIDWLAIGMVVFVTYLICILSVCSTRHLLNDEDCVKDMVHDMDE